MIPSLSPPASISPEEAQRAEVVFHSALEWPAAARTARVAEACGGDGAVRARVLEWLALHERAAGFLEDDTPPSPEIGEQLARLRPEESGETIGPYRLRAQIGEGGFGTVWLAEQERPVRRSVALKIIKIGMDTKEVIARFEQERQALALMDHPNIAKVLDAGVTRFGRPFFAMELVHGVKITEYCDERQLSTAERLELFITVCQAVQHAHHKGVIHRDLKPSNILVASHEGGAVPKVIDFGVAKAAQGRLTELTLHTESHQMIGTPVYMSPEQAELTSLDIDTRSDLYSLGVLLYELLTGRTPIEQESMARLGLDEMRRLIREVDPPRPSLRLKALAGPDLAALARRHHSEPARLPAALRGDLDWIVMKCLEKDRRRRYDTANGLALDLRRHLRNEVVLARPPTAGYLLGRLIRRNELAFAAGAAILLTLLIGIAASVWQAVRAREAERRAVSALDELRASAPAFAEQARGLAAREQFDAAIAKLDYAIKLRPDVAAYLVAKADLLQCQLRLAEAAALYREATRVQPGFARAEASARLCDALLAAPPSAQGRLSRESLAKLYLAMQEEQRPAAELMPAARLLGEQKERLVEYWLARLEDLPLSAERPLKERLTVREDGRLALDLSGTKVLDLTPLTGAPLAELNLSRTDLTDLSSLRGLELAELNISETGVSDLTPLREMHTLEKLRMSDSKVTDLSALAALQLKSLTFQGCDIGDLSPIRKMPLVEMNLRKTRVTDLSPLAGMPIRSIDLGETPLLDFSPLAQLPLEKCYFDGNRIRDLSVLRGKPLRELVLLGCDEARNFTAIADLQTLELLLLPRGFRTLPEADYAAIGALRRLPKLRQLGTAFETRAGSTTPGVSRLSGTASSGDYTATPASEYFWQSWDIEQTFLPALRKSGLNFWVDRLRSGTYELQMYSQPIGDLSIIKGAPISEILLIGGEVTDLSPLAGMPITLLNIPGNPVSDLTPLRGMPLERVFLTGTKVRDLAPLAGLPIKALFLGGCKELTDVAPLTEIPALEHVVVPIQAGGIERLRTLPHLQRLGYTLTGLQPMLPETTAEEFWKDFDTQGWMKKLRAAGIAMTGVKRQPDGTWSADLSQSAIGDLTDLRGASISTLNLSNTAVTDLTPLAGLPLAQLSLRGTRVTDLSALRGLPLTGLYLINCRALTDLSPLAECAGLTSLTLPPGAKEIEFLRALPKLERISFHETPKEPTRPAQTAAQFWEEYDAGKKQAASRPKSAP